MDGQQCEMRRCKWNATDDYEMHRLCICSSRPVMLLCSPLLRGYAGSECSGGMQVRYESASGMHTMLAKLSAVHMFRTAAYPDVLANFDS